MKKCTRCGEEKSLDQFGIDLRNKKDGHRWECNPCNSKIKKKEYETNRERSLLHSRKSYNTWKKDWLLTPEGKWSAFISQCKTRRKVNSLTFEEFNSFWQKPCYYCGKPIVTIGLDRIDSNAGYFLANVVSCCYPCNTMKMGVSFDTFLVSCFKIVRMHIKYLLLKGLVDLRQLNILSVK